MATSGYYLVNFFDTCKDSFYFEVVDPDLDEDSFNFSRESPGHLIQSKDQKYLILNTDGNFEAKDLPTEELLDPEYKFNIRFYKSSETSKPRKGRAVMLYANKNGQKMMVCCNDSCGIYAEAMDLSKMINGTSHKALFYMMEQPASNQYKFESTMHQKMFLGFEPDKNNPGLHRLVLKASDETDRSCNVHLPDYKK